MDLYIIGAGNVGGFIAYHAGEMGDYNLRGFLDDDTSKINQTFYDLPVLGTTDTILHAHREIAVAIAIANPGSKKKLIEKCRKNSNIHFPSFIHPTVWIGQKVSWKEGCIVYPGVTINYETEMGRFVTINMNAAIGHNCRLHDYSTLSPGVNLGGFTQLGEESFIGIGASTLQSITIGEKSIVGAGAIVIKPVSEGVTVAGNPAKIIRKK